MMRYGCVDIRIHYSLTAPLVGVEWPPSRPGRFTSTYCIDTLVGPRARLEAT
jgi:hypothetical protein